MKYTVSLVAKNEENEIFVSSESWMDEAEPATEKYESILWDIYGERNQYEPIMVTLSEGGEIVRGTNYLY